MGRLVMTMIVHNEVDLLDAHLRFHFANGVEHVVAIDDHSTDGTLEVLQSHARREKLTLMERPPGQMFAAQSRWATQMARHASTRCGADWVINGDADEFWWPLRGTLDQSLDAIPTAYDMVLIPRTDFVPLGEDGGDGCHPEQLTVREVGSPIGPRVAHRASDDVVVSSHRVARDAERDWLKWTESGDRSKRMRIAPLFPIRVFHYPVRSWPALVGKVRQGRGKEIDRDPVLRIMASSGSAEVEAAVLASDPEPPPARQRLIADLVSRRHVRTRHEGQRFPGRAPRAPGGTATRPDPERGRRGDGGVRAGRACAGRAGSGGSLPTAARAALPASGRGSPVEPLVAPQGEPRANRPPARIAPGESAPQHRMTPSPEIVEVHGVKVRWVRT